VCPADAARATTHASTPCLPDSVALVPTARRPIHYHTPVEEIGYGPACWLWDYMRRSGAAGFFLPLSGGADSASVAAIVGSMCHLVMERAHAGDPQAGSEPPRCCHLPCSCAALQRRSSPT